MHDIKEVMKELCSIRLKLYRLYRKGILDKESYIEAIRPLDQWVESVEDKTLDSRLLRL